MSDLAFWCDTGDPQNMTTDGAVQQASDLSGNGRHGAPSRKAQADRLTTARRITASGHEDYVVFKTPAASGEPRHFDDTDAHASTSVAMGTPAAIVLGARYKAGPSNHAEVDVLGAVGATKLLSAADQQNLIDWAGLK